MKHFLTSALRVKTLACMIFTAAVLISMILHLFFPDWDITPALLWQSLLISVVGSLLQWLFYSDDVIKTLRYSIRSLLFAPIFFLFIAGCAVLFHWFPMEYASSWLIFTGIFILVFLGFTVGFSIYYRITGRKYDEILDGFKKKQV